MNEKEWWLPYAVASSDTFRAHRYIDYDDIPKIIAEAERLERERIRGLINGMQHLDVLSQEGNGDEIGD